MTYLKIEDITEKFGEAVVVEEYEKKIEIQLFDTREDNILNFIIEKLVFDEMVMEDFDTLIVMNLDSKGLLFDYEYKEIVEKRWN